MQALKTCMHAVYERTDCDGCPFKAKCIRASGNKKPRGERHKVIYVSKRFAQQREHMEAKIFSAKGVLLRVNRSIQAEDTFAFVKEDFGFRRFMQKGRLGSSLVIPASFPAGL